MWQTLKKQEIIEKLRTDEMQGLTEKQVKELQEKEGKNKLADKKKESILIKFIKQFNDFMIIILIIASIISALVSKMQGENDYIDSFIIIAIVILNAIMGVIQEAKSRKINRSIKTINTTKCKTIRNGNIKEINAEELVKGDIVLLEAGNYVPADCRLLETYNLKNRRIKFDRRKLTIRKRRKLYMQKEEQLGRHENMAFMASNSSKWTCKSSSNRNRNENNSRKNSKYDDRKRSTRNTNPKKLGQVGKNIRNSMFSNMHTNFLNRNNKKDRANRNVYDISRISSSSNTRRITSNSNNSAINRGNKMAKRTA